MVQKFAGVPLRHADWISDKKLADQETGCASDGFIMSALACGAHANFDGSVMEDAADDGSISAATYATKGDLVVCNDTVLNTVQALPDVAKGRVFVSQGVGEIPIYAAAPVAAAGAVPLCGAGADIAYVEPAVKGKFLIAQGVAAAPVYSAAAVSTAAGALTVAGAGVDVGYVEPVAANQCLMSNGVNVAPVYSPRFFSGVTAGGGQFAIAGLVATSRVVVTINSTLGNDLVFACAIPNAGGFIQFYTKDITGAAAVPDAAMADGIAVGVVVVKL